MRMSRILLLVVLAAALAGVVVPSASALAFVDDVCPVQTGGVVKICPQGETGKSYSLQMKGREGTGCVPYVTFRVIGTLPTGLSMSSSGLISGTPTQAGEWTFWVEMKDIPASEGGIEWCADSKSTERQFSITIVQGLQILQRQSTLTPAQLNVPYSLQFSATGGTPTWSVSSGSLPPGLTLNSATGLLSGTPTAVGNFTFRITATAGSRSDTQTYSLSVLEPLRVTLTRLPPAEVGFPFTIDFEATGGRPAHIWSVEGALPRGLTLDAATGVLSGTPRVAGTYPLKVTVTDSIGLKTTQEVTLKVAAKLAFVRRPLPAAKVGKLFSLRIPVLGGVLPRQWKLTGLLPTGFKFGKRLGVLTGTPTKAGTFRFTIQVTDKFGATAKKTYVLKVLP
jgi:large repetitive protein